MAAFVRPPDRPQQLRNVEKNSKSLTTEKENYRRQNELKAGILSKSTTRNTWQIKFQKGLYMTKTSRPKRASILMTSMRFRSLHSTTPTCRQFSHESSMTAPKSIMFPQKSPMLSQQSLIFLQKSPNFCNTIPMCRQYRKRALYFRNSIVMCRFALCAWPACTCMLA